MMQIVSAFDEDSPIQAFLRGGNNRCSSEGKELNESCSTLRTAASSSAGDISHGFASQPSLLSNHGFNNFVDGHRDNPISLDEDDEDEGDEGDEASAVSVVAGWPSMISQANTIHHHRRGSSSMSSLSDSMCSLNNAFKNLNSNRPACALNLLLLAKASTNGSLKQHDQQRRELQQQQQPNSQYMRQRSSADSLVSRGMLKASSSSEIMKNTTSGEERRRKLQMKFKRSGMTKTAAANPQSPIIATRLQRKSGMMLPFRGPRHSVIKAKLSLGLRNRLVLDLIQKQSSKK